MKQAILTPVQKFIKTESFSGFLLFFATIAALVLANSPLSDFYNSIWQYEVGIKSDSFKLIKPLTLWINDGFMAVFFFVIGLEIKRELLIGELNSLKKASLPIVGAVGGMIIPLFVFLALNTNADTEAGWGIPMATDIAFTLAILSLLGKNVPVGLKIFLTAFAIIDDLGAVLVIAIFYSQEISWNLIFISFILLGILYVMSYKKIHNKFIFAIFGITIWILFLKSGIHPTIAGILLAFAVPIRQKINEFTYADRLQTIVKDITSDSVTNELPVLSKEQIEKISYLEEWTNKVQSPLQQLEYKLHKWVAYFIMPIFAFANAGISLSSDVEIDMQLIINIAIALVFGKMLGVFLFSYLGLKLKIAQLPLNVNLKQIFGVSILAGVGFTMSLFISNLAFTDSDVYQNSAKLGIIIASVVAGVIGFIILKTAVKSE